MSSDAEKIREWLDKKWLVYHDVETTEERTIIAICRKLLDACEWYSGESQSTSELARMMDGMQSKKARKALEECAKEIG